MTKSSNARDEEIEAAAKFYGDGISDDFIKGAEWADKHPTKILIGAHEKSTRQLFDEMDRLNALLSEAKWLLAEESALKLSFHNRLDEFRKKLSQSEQENEGGE